MTSSVKRKELLERVARLESLAAQNPNSAPIDIHPWLKVTDLPRFLNHARIQAESLAEDKPPIGYPVTNAVFEDFLDVLEHLERVLSNGLTTDS